MSNKINIEFPDGNIKEFEKGISPYEIAKSISGRLARESIVAEFSGKLIDMHKPLENSGKIEFLDFDDPRGRDVFWHSSAHIMAEAVRELYDDVKVAIGPSIENGFYYDFDREEPFSEDDLEEIQKKMKEITKRDNKFICKEMDKEEAVKLFDQWDENYKLELLEDIEDDKVTVYESGDFTDLCRGPHIPSAKRVKAIKLLSVAGAYWRGDERNKMLQRIYGITFPKKKLLDQHLEMLEESRRRDHRKLGAELDLFMTDPDIGPGLILWKPKGGIMRRVIENFMNQEHEKRGYEILYTPHIARHRLWELSGHADFYTGNMFKPMEVEGDQYQIRPMNCPFHIVMYKSELRSYRELPIRWSELGADYRYERSGVLHGLTRVRGFTMDDAHIFCTKEQLPDEIKGVMDLALFVFKTFGFEDLELYLSTRPKKFVGDPEVWDIAEKALQETLDSMGLDYILDPGEGAFYGPKIDLKVKDALGRSWQCSTIQVDFNIPERFDITYIDENDQKKQPIMIHRAILGSLERFFGILIEHYAGNFPLWLSPVQAMVLPISEKYEVYAEKVYMAFKEAGIRAKIDQRSEKIGYRIREAEMQKVNYMLIVGEREEEDNTVSIRKHGEGDIGSKTLDEAIESFRDEIARRC